MINVKENIGEDKYNELFSNRKNRILLALLESEEYRDAFRLYYNELMYNLDSADLFDLMRKNISTIFGANSNIQILDFNFYSNKYVLDNNGICKDGDIGCIRYKSLESGKIYKMKASKFFHKLTENIKVIPTKALHWEAEVFADKRKAFLLSISEYSLHTGSTLEDFKKIYTSNSIHSCMSGGEYYNFYVDSVDATAAWLEDKEGNVVARCVIFNKVKDTIGNIYRLAERQYSVHEYLKEFLIHKLINANLIDGYKKIGAGSYSTQAFYIANGEKLLNNNLIISCQLYQNSTLSFQDSFAWYCDFRKEAYNFCPVDKLNTTINQYSSATNTFIKCPNCGNTFKHRKYHKKYFYYCSEKCLKEGKETFLDNGIQRIQVCKLWKYLPELNKRKITYSYINSTLYLYEGEYYEGYSTTIDGITIPSEKVIQQFDLNGNLVEEYADYAQIKLKLNKENIFSISKALLGKYKTAYSYKWKYKGFIKNE